MPTIISPPKPKGQTAYDLADLISQTATTDDPEILAELWERIEIEGADLREHVDQLMDHRRDLTMTVAGIDSEIKRLQELKAERLGRTSQIERLLSTWMDAIDTSEVITDTYTIRRKLNPHRVDVIDESIIPAAYMKEKVTQAPDKNAIKAALKEGIPVEGCRLIQESRLEIK